MKERIILLIRSMNYTAAQFADEIGVQKSGISHIISGRNNPSLDFVQKILTRFPEVSAQWLLFGKGPMYQDRIASLNEKTEAVNGPIQSDNQLNIDLFSELKVAENTKNERQTDRGPEKSNAVFLNTPEPAVGKRLINEKRNDQKETEHFHPTPGRFTGDAKAERIVIFYSDNTFREYFPEN